MIGAFIEGLIIAWILSFFHIDYMIQSVAWDWFNVNLSNSGYYILFGIIGIIGHILF